MKELDPTTVESSELVEQTFNFWFNDREHIRSPFPAYIHPELKEKSTQLFFEWTSGLNEKASEEINEVIIGEKFEEIIFETALELVKFEDEKITISYPFLPRLEDVISDVEGGTEMSVVIDRWIKKEKDHVFLHMKLERVKTKEIWETSFELPV